MHILVLADNYLPEIAATSYRTSEHAKVWLEAGHQVTVVTCVPNWPHGRVFRGYRNRAFQTEWIDGVRVIRLGTYIAANRGFLRRCVDYLSFCLAAVFWCWRFPPCDVVLATSPQFFTALAGFLVAKLKRRPWVFEVRDLWPDSIKAVGVSRGRLIAALEWLELFLYRRADRILVVTCAFRRNLVSRGIPHAKIDVVTNGVDGATFQPRPRDPAIRRRLGVPADAFLVGYLGTTGLAHGLETVVDAAAQTAEHSEIYWAIIGEGATRTQLDQQIQRRKLTNIQTFDRVPHEQMPEYLAAFDAALIHLKPDPLFETVIPSKLFEYMAMEMPVIHGVAGESAELVDRHQCGICVSPGNSMEMAQAVVGLASRPEQLRRYGKQGRRAATQLYDRRQLGARALETLLQAGQHPATSGRATAGRATARAAGSDSRRKAA